MRRALIVLLTMVCVAALLSPLMASRPAGDYYEASGRTTTLSGGALPNGLISVNSADLYELTELPGVGETIGQRIIDERERGGPFYYPEDMLTVRGIGKKTLENFRDLLDMAVPEED